jgi:hypothetical protein
MINIRDLGYKLVSEKLKSFIININYLTLFSYEKLSCIKKTGGDSFEKVY